MTPFDQLILFLVSLRFSPWFFVKFLFLIGLLLYIAFAVVVVRQVNLMTQTLNVKFESLLRFIALIHLLVAIGIFLLAIITL